MDAARVRASHRGCFVLPPHGIWAALITGLLFPAFAMAAGDPVPIVTAPHGGP